MHMLLLFPLLAPVPPLQAAPADGRAPILDQRKLRQAMTRLQSEHPDLVNLLSVGTSRSGEKIEALRIASGEAWQGRPAILVVANLDGPMVYTSGIALEHASSLVARYATDPAVKQLLDGTTLYVVPRANPDGAAARFSTPLVEVSATGHGVDNDRDARAGEDGWTDIDGDGRILHMRVPDPEGRWTEDPTDPRVLIEADPLKGQVGRWKLVPEGRDTDGDGEASEDPPLDAVVNRNFPYLWEEHAPESGLFPTDEPEARALCDFVLARTDIQVVVVYGELDNLAKPPTSVDDDAPDAERVPPVGVRKSDSELIAEIGRRYAENVEQRAEGFGKAEGSFQSWCYAERGLIVLSITPWAIPLEGAGEGDTEGEEVDGTAGAEDSNDSSQAALGDTDKGARGKKDGAPQPSDDAKRMKWIEAQTDAERFVAWAPFEHPELGPVEIGGFAPYARIEPPPADRIRIADEQLGFLLAVGDMLARIELADVWAADLGGGVWEVEASLENRRLLPLRTTWGRRTETVRPAKVRLRLPPDAKLLAGPRVELVDDLPGSGGRRTLRWLVRGAEPRAIGISVETDNAGAAQAVPEVKP